MKQYFFFLVFSLLLLASCKEKTGHHPINFYYWKTNVSLGDTEKEYFAKLESKKLYIRFFDVDNTGEGIYPQAKIKKFDKTNLRAEYIPVVFITNRTFLNINQPEVDSLAKNITSLINEIAEANGVNPINEIQIDCDWTERTKDKYFRFLEILKNKSQKNISCTIRLHQIAYKEKTGVPPVLKGCLMCYATSQPTEFTEKNSILDMNLLQSYTKNINDYPINFDIALPLYSWAVVTNHLGKAKLINGVTKEELENQHYFKPIDNNFYEITEDFFFHNIYLNKGFKIKIEGITPQLLNEAKLYLNNKITRNYEIIYYHLDKPFIQRFSIDDLK